MAVSEMISQLHGMSETDLLTLNASVVRHLKYARKRRTFSLEITSQWVTLLDSVIAGHVESVLIRKVSSSL